MKVFFDTNVYVAEALLGQMAERLLEATERASWRIYANPYLLDELERVMTEKLEFSNADWHGIADRPDRGRLGGVASARPRSRRAGPMGHHRPAVCGGRGRRGLDCHVRDRSG